MKKKLSLFLAVTMVLSMLMPMSITTVSAATVDQSNPAHLIMDFEDGKIGNSDSDTDYTAELVDGAGVSAKALKVTTSGTGAPSFTFGYRPGYTYTRSGETVTVERKYEFSAWIKVDSEPTSDTVVLKHEIQHPEYNSSWYNFTPEKLEKTFLTIDRAGLKAGEWVKVSGEFVTDQNNMSVDATYKYYTSSWNASLGYNQQEGPYTYTYPTAMPVKVVVGGGMSYTIDDFVIMTTGCDYTYSNTPESAVVAEGLPNDSDRFYKEQGQNLGGVRGWNLYTFKDELTTTANSNGWKVANGTADLTSANGESVAGETLSGRYATITSTESDGQLVCEDIDYRFGTAYGVYVWAKAENDAAQKARLQAVVSLKDRTDTENITEDNITAYATSIRPADGNQSVYLTSEWRQYYFTFKTEGATYDEELADFILKLTDNGTGADLTGAKYSLGNIKFYQQTGTTASCLDAKGTIKAYPLGNNSYNVDLDSYVNSGNITNCLTRVMVPFNGDYVIVKTFTNWRNEESFQITADNITGFKMVVNPRDRSNHYGEEYVAFAKEIEDYGVTAVAEFDQTIWASDMPNLTATIRYNAPKGSETLKALCGMYDENNRMVASDIKEFTLSAGEGSMTLSMDTVAEAVTAKVFLWEADSYAPRKDDVPVLTKTTNANFVYVDAKKGTDNTTYGYYNPLKTLAQANAALSAIKSSSPKDTYVILMPGLHQVESTFELTGANTSADYNVVFTSYNKNDKGVISGGTDLTGEFTEYKDGIYRAPVPVGTQSRQLYVDGVKGVRARSEGRLEGFTNTTVYNNDKSLNTLGAIVATDTKYKDFNNINDLEFIFYSKWTMGRCGVTHITPNDDGTITFNMDAVGFENLSSKGNTRAIIPAYIENAYELIDQGGEWYLDEEGDGTNGYLYYLPREGEDMTKAEVILPTFDNYFKKDGPMISVTGTADAPVRNVEFNGVEFSHTTWTRPSTQYGHSDVQNNHLRETINSDVPSGSGDRLVDGAIDVTYADSIDFLNCDFTRLGITALRILDGSDNCNVTGNEFYYISGSAMNIGQPFTGLGKTPEVVDERILDNINVTNNYIHHVAHDYWSAAAISAGHPRNSTIEHNEICNIPYSGMHIGYGWSTYESSTMTLKIENNYIHDLFQGDIYDGAGIYTIGGTGGTAENPCTLRGNYIQNIGPGAATLYNDQGSRYWLVENNVSDIRYAWGETDPTTGEYKGLSNCMNINMDDNDVTRDNHLIWRNNYSSVNNTGVSSKATTNDTTVQLEDPVIIDMSTGAWNTEAQAIIANAGIQEKYRSNFDFGLRAISVPKNIALAAGETFANKPCAITGKDTLYKSDALVVSAVSSNEAVATATADTITAVSAGTATITYTVIENGVIYNDKTVVTVSHSVPSTIEFENCHDNSLNVNKTLTGVASGDKYILTDKGDTAPSIKASVTIPESRYYTVTYTVGQQLSSYLSPVTIKLGNTVLGTNDENYEEDLYNASTFFYKHAPMRRYVRTVWLDAGTYELTADIGITRDSAYKYQMDYIRIDLQ